MKFISKSCVCFEQYTKKDPLFRDKGLVNCNKIWMSELKMVDSILFYFPFSFLFSLHLFCHLGLGFSVTVMITQLSELQEGDLVLFSLSSYFLFSIFST